MKSLLLILAMTTTTAMAMAQNGKATTEKKTFSRTTSVSIDINADPAVVWKLLTTAADYPKWNTTIVGIEGSIAEGGRIKLKTTLAPKRTFKLKIKELETQRRLVWGDGQGTRVFTLAPAGNGKVTFSMNEKIGGFMFPMYAKHIPSFDGAFEQFAADLKKAAEING